MMRSTKLRDTIEKTLIGAGPVKAGELVTRLGQPASIRVFSFGIMYLTKQGMPEMAEQKLKLWVVGESSGNPEEWININPSRAFVIAPSSERAIEIADDLCVPVAAEIDLSQEGLIEYVHHETRL